jgi:hypothetical protein
MEAFQHPDGRLLRLGKQRPRIDSRTLRLARYLAPDIAPAPPSCDYSKGLTSWGMMDNDSLGCCVISALGHALQLVTMNTTGILTVPDATILKYYEWFGGYVPGDPSTDNGCVELDVLNLLRKVGFAQRALLAYAAVSPLNAEHVRKTIELFGFAFPGLALPVTAQSQVGGLWDVVGNPATDPNSQPGSWGGHCPIVIAYDASGLTCVTWGALQKMTWRFWNAYCDEAYGLLLGYVVCDALEPAGFSTTDLMADLAVVTG